LACEGNARAAHVEHRRVVAAALPANKARAKNLLFAASRLVLFALDVGLVLDQQMLLCDAVIERFCASAKVGSLASRRTLRANYLPANRTSAATGNV